MDTSIMSSQPSRRGGADHTGPVAGPTPNVRITSPRGRRPSSNLCFEEVSRRVADITVLIVDDQPIYRTALADLLEIVGGYRVVGSAATAEEAIEALRRSPVDLVFMDLRLPGMDGLAATRQIRSAVQAPEVIIISTDVEALSGDDLGTSGALEARAKADLDPDWLDALRVRMSGEAEPRAGRE